MNRDDFELASNGYRVQNDRPARAEADRNDNTSCHASALAGRSARASTCQTWSPWAMTLHGMRHHLANKGPPICWLTPSPVNSWGPSVPSGGERLEALGELLRGGPGLAAPNRPAVQLGDGHDLGGRAGEEHLVCRVQVVAVQRQLFDGVGRLARYLDHG